MSEQHIDIITEQFGLTIDKLIDEGYSEIDILKALASVIYDFTDGFEEVLEDE